MWAGLAPHGVSRASRLPCLFQLPGASHSHWLLAPSSTFSPATSGRVLPLLRIIYLREGQLFSHLRSACNLSSPWPGDVTHPQAIRIGMWASLGVYTLPTHRVPGGLGQARHSPLRISGVLCQDSVSIPCVAPPPIPGLGSQRAPPSCLFQVGS